MRRGGVLVCKTTLLKTVQKKFRAEFLSRPAARTKNFKLSPTRSLYAEKMRQNTENLLIAAASLSESLKESSESCEGIREKL